MKFCQSVLSKAIDILLHRRLKHVHTIFIGENASGKSKVLREYVKAVLSEDKSIFYIDAVNRSFDISKVSTPYSEIDKSNYQNIVKKRIDQEYFNLKDTFCLFGTLNDQIELIYLQYEKQLQNMLKEFGGFSFEIKNIKEKEVFFDSGTEGLLSSGLQALVRIFLELLYVNDIVKGHICVVIDEIDEFLSPANAGKILGFLMEQFPNMEFLVTTHSIDLVRNSKKCNIVILYDEDLEVIDADDFCSEYDVTALFEKVFPVDKMEQDAVEDKLRILLNNRISGIWYEDNEAELRRLKEMPLTNSQKLLVQQIEEW